MVVGPGFGIAEENILGFDIPSGISQNSVKDGPDNNTTPTIPSNEGSLLVIFEI